MRKILSAILMIALVLSLGSTAFAYEVSQEMDATQIESGEEVAVTLTLDEAMESVVSFQVNLYYDAELFTLKSSEKGEAHASMTITEAAKNDANGTFYAVSVIDPASVGITINSGKIYTLVFVANDDVQEGEGVFTLSAEVWDASFGSKPMDVDVSDDVTVTIIPSACAEHTWDEGIVTKEPTCEEAGEMSYTCSVCGRTKVEPIAALGHKWVDGAVVEPTCTEAGSKTRTCSVCGAEEKETIPAKGHNYGDDNICDDCGYVKSDSVIRPVGPSKDAEESEIVLPFTDVTAADWFYNDVVYVYENGLMNGMTATTFGPYGNTTRGQIVTILWRLEGQPAVSGACPFTDVAVGSYYEQAITWAAANGIVTGYDATTFGPDDQITREQMAAILYRYAMGKQLASPALVDNLAVFTDAANVSAYAVEAMNWAVSQGLINGMGDGTVAPQGQAIRAQAAAILHRFCDTLELL